MNLKKYIPKDGKKMTKNEFKQIVNFISEYEKRLFEKNNQNENLFRDNRAAYENLKSQQKEINRLKTENEELKANVKELEIELNRRVIK